MGLCLIAASSASGWWGYGEVALAVVLTIFGLGLLIFVHELGHFAVAKMCGVRCDRFFLGFDVPLGRFINWLLRRPGEFSLFGLKIPRTIGPTVKVGETTYGIGILPLGGYVGMLGQNDDPRMSEEQIRQSQLNDGDDPTKEIIGPDGQKITVNARSYIAKSVPQKMAIISAGVVMNVIFAFLLAIWAFELGVPTLPCAISGTDPGAPAWVSGLQPDDRIVRINELRTRWFEQLQSEVMLSGEGDVVEFEIERPGVEGTLVYELRPSRQRRKIAQVGAAAPWSLELPAMEDPYRPYSPAAQLKDRLQPKSQLVAVGGQPVATHGQLEQQLLLHADQPLELTFEQPPKKGQTEKQTYTVTVGPNPREHVGLVMKMGPITAIQNGSPAAKAGLQVGDRILAIDETTVGADDQGNVGIDPALLDGPLLAAAEEDRTVELTVLRRNEEGDEPERLTLSLEPRIPTQIEVPMHEKSPMSAATLGIAYYLTNQIDAVLPGSPADRSGLKPGERLQSAQLAIPENLGKEFKPFKKPLALDQEQQSWAFLQQRILQDLPAEIQLVLEVQGSTSSDGDPRHVREVKVGITEQAGVFTPERGLVFMPMLVDRQGETLAESTSMALTETGRALTSVYRFLYRLTSGDMPVAAMGGPVTIARASYLSAMQGFPTLLLFLTLISANLAVVNFLPIPVLDGGHMMFLAYEGIVGRPPNENLSGLLTMAGLGLIVCLMVFVFALDLGFIERNL